MITPCSVRIPYALLWLSVFVLPWEEVWVAFGTFGTIGLISVVLALLAAVFCIVTGERIKPLTPLLVVTAFFILWAGLTSLWSVNPDLSITRLANYLVRFSFIWLIWQTARSAKELTGLMEAYLLGCFVLGILTIDNYFWGEQQNYGRFTPGDIDPNYMAFTIALAFPMFVCLLKQGIAVKRKGAYSVLMAVGIGAIFLSGSRGGFVALMLGVALCTILFFKDIIRHPAAAGLVLVLTGLTAFYYAGHSIPSVERLLSIGDDISRGDWSRRFDVWEAGVRVFLSNMLLGVGLHGFSTAIGSYSTSVGGFYAHNTYLTILVEQGIIGFIGLLAILLVLLVAVCSMPAAERKSMFILLFVWAAGSYVLNWDHHRATWFVWGIISAYAGIIGLPQLHQDINE